MRIQLVNLHHHHHPD
ncbi:his operon leader peptide [Photobacterium sp. TLY01]